MIALTSFPPTAGPLARRLLIVSHVTHYQHGGRVFAYGPYAREIGKWAEIFPQITIAAPCHSELPPGDCLPLPSKNVSLAAQPETGGTTLPAKLAQIAMLPYSIWRLGSAMANADAIHVRCPGNLGLLGALLAPLFSRQLIAKYAGQWSSYPGEPWTVRLQRAILRSRWWSGPVLVYDRGRDQPKHIVPFFTSILDAVQMERAKIAASRRMLGHPLRVAYIGRLSRQKNVDALLRSLATLKRDGVTVECTIVGDGPELHTLIALTNGLGIQTQVRFTGAVKFERVLDHYEQADVLVLPSSTEGWPKTIAEAMAFGLVCIGPDRGIVPDMLAHGRGIIIHPGDTAALAGALRRITEEPDEYRTMQDRAAEWAQQFTLERFGVALTHALRDHWATLSGSVHIGAAHV